MNWTNFSINEIVNPLFDDCPYSWIELSGEVKRNLIHTMDLVQELRSHMGLGIRLNSTYRPKSKGAHGSGKAVDCQFYLDDTSAYLRAMNWLKQGCSQTGFRVIMEWSGRPDGIPWFHVDRNYKDYGAKVLVVGYPTDGVPGNKMEYAYWTGGLPGDYV